MLAFGVGAPIPKFRRPRLPPGGMLVRIRTRPLLVPSTDPPGLPPGGEWILVRTRVSQTAETRPGSIPDRIRCLLLARGPLTTGRFGGGSGPQAARHQEPRTRETQIARGRKRVKRNRHGTQKVAYYAKRS